MSDADLRTLLPQQFADHRTPDALHLHTYEDGSFTEAWKTLRTDEHSTAFVVDAVADSHLGAVAAALRRDGSSRDPALVVGAIPADIVSTANFGIEDSRELYFEVSS